LADVVIYLSADQGNNAAPPVPAPPPPPIAVHEDDDDDDEVAVAGPRIQAHVNLAKTITRTYTFIFDISITVM
jgi:hypothetical protein